MRGISLVMVLVAVFSVNLRPGEAPEAAPQSPPPSLTERDYLVEELGLAEELLRIEEARAEQAKGSPEKILAARRSVLSLKRQLAAYDERTKRPTPAQEAERKRRAEEEQRKAEARKREADAEADRSRTLKQELLSVLLDVAQEDADARVRLAAVSSDSSSCNTWAIGPTRRRRASWWLSLRAILTRAPGNSRWT